MVERLLLLLLTQSIVLSLAFVAVKALQTATRGFGAGAAYAAWLLVPMAMLAAAVPHPAVDAIAVRVDVSTITPAWIAAPASARAADRSVAVTAAALAWGAGAALIAGLLVQRQRRFEALVRAPSSGAAPALPAGAGPAVLGVWRRRIVLPQDFDSAFDAEERRLMLMHEGVHLRRADNAWNLLAATMLVLHWFNPVAWWAWRGLRADQETSCDAAVLRHESPAALAVYAAALLKVQGVALTPPFATSWQSTHPLVERVRMLQLHSISSARHRAGLRVTALAILVAGFGGYALRAGASAVPMAASADPYSVLTSIEVEFDKSAETRAKIAAKLLTRTGEKSTVRFNSEAISPDQGRPFEIVYTATRLSGDRVQIDAELHYGDASGSPRVITHDGEAARVEIKSGDGAHTFAVTLVPKLIPQHAAMPDGVPDPRKPADQRPL